MNVDDVPGAVHMLASLPVTVESLGFIRRIAERCASDAGLDDQQTYRFLMAVSETMSNTVEHAGSTGHLTLLQATGSALYAVVTDRGSGLAKAPAGPPPPAAIRGRGIWLTTSMADGVEVRTSSTGTLICLTMTIKN